jgi:hypothetical protein
MASTANRLRTRAVLLSRAFKDLFAMAVLPIGWPFNWLFRGENGDLRRVGEYVLADLNRFCGGKRLSMFDKDPLEMARRAGRREVFDRIAYFLNLDEDEVRQLMELDDGN